MARKTFKVIEGNDKEVELAVRPALSDDFEEADRVYAAKVSVLVRDADRKKNVLLRREVETFLKEHNIWTTEDESKIKNIQTNIDDLLFLLRKGGIPLSEVRKTCIKIADKRGEMVKIMSKRRIFDDVTIESFAETDRNDYLVYICTVYNSDGRNYWQSFEDMKNDKLSDAYRQASTLVYEIVYGVNPEFEKMLPENKLLVKLGFVDKDLNFVDRKTGEYVDKEGNPLNLVKEVEEKINRFNSLQGEIAEEVPFIDDETGQPLGEEKVENPVNVEATKEKKVKKPKKTIEIVNGVI